jgi:peptide/nickel transport system permease protein
MPAPSPDNPEDRIRDEVFDEPAGMTSTAGAGLAIALADHGEVPVGIDGEPTEAPKKKLGVGFWAGVGWLALMVVLALLAPLLTSDSTQKFWSGLSGPPYDRIVAKKNLWPPSGAHPLGTDQLGRDVLSRIIWGGRVSLLVGVASIVFGLVIGSFIGIIAGYFKGWIESTLMGAMDVILAFPPILLALALVSLRVDPNKPADAGGRLPILILSIGIVAIPPIARLVRANTLIFREREFVLASRTLGASNLRVIGREILPNVIPPIIYFAVIGVSVAIVAEGALAYFGLSVPPPVPSWGTMIADGKDAITSGSPQITLVPGAIMFLTVCALYLIADGLRVRYDVKETAL